MIELYFGLIVGAIVFIILMLKKGKKMTTDTAEQKMPEWLVTANKKMPVKAPLRLLREEDQFSARLNEAALLLKDAANEFRQIQGWQDEVMTARDTIKLYEGKIKSLEDINKQLTDNLDRIRYLAMGTLPPAEPITVEPEKS